MDALNSAQATAAIAEIRRAFHSGLSRKGFSAVDAAALLAAGPVAALAWDWWPPSAEQASIESAFRALQPQIESWAGSKRRWAERGTRDDGARYTWEQFFSLGRDFASAIRLHTGELANAGLFQAVVGAAAQTAQDVRDLAVTAGGAVIAPLENLHIIAAGAGVVALAYLAFRFLPRRA